MSHILLVKYRFKCGACVFLVNTVLQIFQSVKEGWMIVTQMQLAQTHLEVITVFATLDLPEMDTYVQVSNNLVIVLHIYKF